MNRTGLCNCCEHDFLDRHIELDRREATLVEWDRRWCSDCLDCNPPETAPVREQGKELVPA